MSAERFYCKKAISRSRLSISGATGLKRPTLLMLRLMPSVTKLKPRVPGAMAKPTDISFQAEMSQARLDCNYNRAENTLTLSGSSITGSNPSAKVLACRSAHKAAPFTLATRAV